MSRKTMIFLAGAAAGFFAGYGLLHERRPKVVPRPVVDPTILLEEIDLFLDYLLRSRSLFPHMEKSMIRAREFDTAPFYRASGYDVHFRFSTPLTGEEIDRINNMGHWHNQNYLVRLGALLESRHVFSVWKRIDRSVPGAAEVDVLRRLRNVVAHSSGRYDSTNRRHRQVYRRVKDLFHTVGDPGTATDFPLDIDKVLLPITAAGRLYVRSLAEKEAETRSPRSGAPSSLH